MNHLAFKKCLLSTNCMEIISKHQAMHTLIIYDSVIGEDKIDSIEENESSDAENFILCLKNLRHLKIEESLTRLDSKFMFSLVDTCKLLESVWLSSEELYNITQEEMLYFLDKMKYNLKGFDWNLQPNNELHHIEWDLEQIFFSLANCKNLENLKLGRIRTNLHRECAVTGISNLKNLCHLEITADNMESEHIAQMFSNRNSEKMISIKLNLDQMYGIELDPEVLDEVIKIIAKGCPNLESLDISYCKNLQIETINFLSEKCKKIKKLIFSRSESCQFKNENSTIFQLNRLPEEFMFEITFAKDRPTPLCNIEEMLKLKKRILDLKGDLETCD